MIPALEIVETGARTPVGLFAETSAAAVRAGISRTRECPLAAINADGEPKVVAADPKIGFALEGVDRLVPLASSVINEVAGKLGLRCSKVPLDVVLTLPEPRPGMPEHAIASLVRRLPAELKLDLAARGARAEFSVAGRGNAGIAAAIQSVTGSTRQRDDALILVVGVDSFLHPETLLWLEHGNRFGPDARNAIIPGEGAGCLVLATSRLRAQLGLPSRATVDGVGVARESLPADSETGAFGVGMTAAIKAAMTDLRLPEQAADMIYSDINGERDRSEEWGFVAMRVPEAFRVIEYETLAGSCGDTGAASGALAAVLAVQAWARGYARGPRALVIGGSRDGTRGAILLRHTREAQ